MREASDEAKENKHDQTAYVKYHKTFIWVFQIWTDTSFWDHNSQNCSCKNILVKTLKTGFVCFTCHFKNRKTAEDSITNYCSDSEGKS